MRLVQFMLYSLSYTNVFIFLSFVIVLILTWKKSQLGPKITGKLPPGPRALPLIGNIHQLVGALPHVALNVIAKKYGPLVYMKLGQVPTVVVSSAEMAKEFLINKDPAFTDRPKRIAFDLVWYNYEDMAFTSYTDSWKQLRKICVMELLSRENVRSFGYIREDEIAKLTNTIRSHLDLGEEPINVTNLVFAFSSSIICRAAFGSLNMNNERMIKGVKESLHLAGGFYLADLFPSFKFLAIITGLKSKLTKIHKDMDFIVDEILNRHKFNHAKGRKGNSESGDEDLIDVLLRLKASGNLDIPISEKNVKAVILDMFAAGTDTSAATVEWIMSELMRHPEVRAKAQKEVRDICKGKKTIDEADIKKMTYIKMVINETLRLHPATPFVARACREDCKINGYTILKNTQVIVNAGAILRDPRYWDDPETFKPERFERTSTDSLGTNCEYIPFGAGRRICPGIAFGVANIETTIVHLLFHFNWSLPIGMNPKHFDMEESFGLAVTRKNILNLVATAYNP